VKRAEETSLLPCVGDRVRQLLLTFNNEYYDRKRESDRERQRERAEERAGRQSTSTSVVFRGSITSTIKQESFEISSFFHTLLSSDSSSSIFTTNFEDFSSSIFDPNGAFQSVAVSPQDLLLGNF
jgi:hypothetical protein